MARLLNQDRQMSTPRLVEEFYERIWNAGELGAASTLLRDQFVFRGSLGTELTGREAFADYVRAVRGRLSASTRPPWHLRWWTVCGTSPRGQPVGS